MNLVPTTLSAVEQNGTFKYATENGHDPRMELGRCIGQIPTQNGGGRIFQCNAGVYGGNGFADLDGAPFHAYYCVPCGNVLRNAS